MYVLHFEGLHAAFRRIYDVGSAFQERKEAAPQVDPTLRGSLLRTIPNLGGNFGP
jgi:hypothetical protein